MVDLEKISGVFNLDDVDRELGETYWSPVDVVTINDWVLRAAAVKGAFHWHRHDDDEFFLVYRGQIVIDTEDGPVELKTGECAVVRKGVQHRPRAEERAVILMLEPSRLKSRGD